MLKFMRIFNPGWTAELNAHPLRPVTLDGWQQAFVAPAGRGGTITLRFQPASVYHAAIIASGILLLVLAGIALGNQAAAPPKVPHSRGQTAALGAG